MPGALVTPMVWTRDEVSGVCVRHAVSGNVLLQLGRSKSITDVELKVI